MSHLKNTLTVIQVGSRSRYTYLSNEEQIAEIVAAEGKKVGVGCSLIVNQIHRPSLDAMMMLLRYPSRDRDRDCDRDRNCHRVRDHNRNVK